MHDVRSVAMGGNHTGRDVTTVERLIVASLVGFKLVLFPSDYENRANLKPTNNQLRIE